MGRNEYTWNICHWRLSKHQSIFYNSIVFQRKILLIKNICVHVQKTDFVYLRYIFDNFMLFYQQNSSNVFDDFSLCHLRDNERSMIERKMTPFVFFIYTLFRHYTWKLHYALSHLSYPIKYLKIDYKFIIILNTMRSCMSCDHQESMAIIEKPKLAQSLW